MFWVDDFSFSVSVGSHVIRSKLNHHQAAQLPGVTPALRITLCHGWHTFPPPTKKQVHRDSFRFSMFLSCFFFFFNLKVLLEEFGLYGWWSYCFVCFSIGFLCPFLFGLGGYRDMGVFRMICDWIPLQVMYKDQLQLEHWRSCLPSAIIFASWYSSLGLQILLEDSNLNWVFCLFRRYDVSFLSLSVWFCGYWLDKTWPWKGPHPTSPQMI